MALQEHPADQRVAVAVQAAGGEADNPVAHADHGAIDNLIPFHHPHHKAGQVIIAGLVDAGHLRGLPADQGAPGLLAPLGDAFDNQGGGFRRQLPHGQVVQEEQRGGPVDHDIIGAHGHQVDADGIMAVHQDGDFNLGPHPIGGGYQHRVAIPVRPQMEHTAKRADLPQDPGAVGGFHQVSDAFDKGIRSVDIDPGILIGAAVGHPSCLPLRGGRAIL